jgi:hypothetical protein
MSVSLESILLIMDNAAHQRKVEIKAATIQSSESSYFIMMLIQVLRWKGIE